jgi:hypothetical protein
MWKILCVIKMFVVEYQQFLSYPSYMFTLHSMQEKAYRVGHGFPAVHMLQLKNYWMNFDKILYRCYATEGYPKFVYFNLWICKVGGTLWQCWGVVMLMTVTQGRILKLQCWGVKKACGNWTLWYGMQPYCRVITEWDDCSSTGKLVWLWCQPAWLFVLNLT